MAEKLQSKVKLRSGEVVTVDHVKPSKPTSTPKDDKKPSATKTEEEKPTSKETKTSEKQNTNVKPKETK